MGCLEVRRRDGAAACGGAAVRRCGGAGRCCATGVVWRRCGPGLGPFWAQWAGAAALLSALRFVELLVAVPPVAMEVEEVCSSRAARLRRCCSGGGVGAVPAASSAFLAARPARSGGVAALLPCSVGGTPVVAARLWVVAGSGRPVRVFEVGGFEPTTAALFGVADPPGARGWRASLPSMVVPGESSVTTAPSASFFPLEGVTLELHAAAQWGAFGGEALASRCCHVLILICCGSLETVLVCLGAVKPFVYAGGSRLPWRRLAARSLRPPPRCRWCRGVGWSRLCASVRLR
jgi:hypothetical protein